MQTRTNSYRIFSVVFVFSLLQAALCYAEMHQSISRAGVTELLDFVHTELPARVVVIDVDATVPKMIAEALGGPVALTAVIGDAAAAKAWQEEIAQEKENILKETGLPGEGFPDVMIVQGKPLKTEFYDANIIIFLPEITEQEAEKLVARYAKLPEGTRIFSRVEYPAHESVRFIGSTSVSVSPTTAVSFYEYVIKRPTPAEVMGEVLHDINGFRITQEEADAICKQGGDATYGEITLSPAEKLFTEFVPLTEKDVFYDLGCGVGRLTLWASLATPVKASKGIELSPTRYDLACKACDIVEKQVVPKCTQCGTIKRRCEKAEFMCKNMLEADLSDATVIFMCATCFSEDLMRKMADKFAQLTEGLRIVTMKEFPTHPSLRLIATHRLPMTWSLERGSPVYVYEMRHSKLYDLVDQAYKDVSGFTIEEQEAEQIRSKGGAPTYGEITPEAARVLFKEAFQLTADSVFYDLGCGVGKLVAQAFLETPVKRAVGVELSPTRFAAAEKARTAILEGLKQEPYALLWKNAYGDRASQKEVSFVNKNIMEVDLSDATAVFACATCFSDDLMKSITEFCKKLPHGSRIATLKKLTDCKNVTLIKTYQLAMTWSKKVDVYVYEVA